MNSPSQDSFPYQFQRDDAGSWEVYWHEIHLGTFDVRGEFNQAESRHYHVANPVDRDACYKCGRNFRDFIHLRQGE